MGTNINVDGKWIGFTGADPVPVRDALRDFARDRKNAWDVSAGRFNEAVSVVIDMADDSYGFVQSEENEPAFTGIVAAEASGNVYVKRTDAGHIQVWKTGITPPPLPPKSDFERGRDAAFGALLAVIERDQDATKQHDVGGGCFTYAVDETTVGAPLVHLGGLEVIIEALRGRRNDASWGWWKSLEVAEVTDPIADDEFEA